MSTTGDRSGAGERAVQQAPGLWHTDLQRQDLSVPGREVVQSRVDIGPEAPLVRRTHPGEEIIYVLEGSLEYQIEGQAPKTFHAGEALTVPAGAIHAGEECRQRQRGPTRHLCRRERQAAPHGGRVSC
jgi:quercetin dioxygenase-like cupin family protein